VTTLFDWSRVEPSRRTLVEEAEEVAKRVSSGRDFFDGFAIGHGVLVVQEQTMSEARTDDPSSHAYRSAWRAVAAEYPHIAGLDKTERHYYAWMAENEAPLREWRGGLNPKQKRAWNHPRTVYNHAPCGKAAKPPSERKLRQAPATREDIIELRAELTDEIARTADGARPYDLSTPEKIADAVKVCVDYYGKSTAREFSLGLVKATAPEARNTTGPKRNKFLTMRDELEKMEADFEKLEKTKDDVEEKLWNANHGKRHDQLSERLDRLTDEYDELERRIEDYKERLEGLEELVSPWDTADEQVRRAFVELLEDRGLSDLSDIDDWRAIAEAARAAAASGPPQPAGAEAQAPPEDAPQPEVADALLPPVLAKLQAAGGNGMSTYELMQIVGFDPASLTAALAPFMAADSVIEREGRYFYRMSEAEFDREREGIRATYGDDDADEEQGQDSESPFLTEAEQEVLDKIGEQHESGKPWVGPKWRKDNGISAAMVAVLVEKGELRRNWSGKSVQRINTEYE